MASILGSEYVAHIGILVWDCDKAAQDYARFLNVPVPEVTINGTYEETLTKYMGQPTRGRVRQTNFQITDNLVVELLQPVDKPSEWYNELEKKGEGFHHIALRTKDLDEGIELALSKGMTLTQTGQWDTGCYAYLNGMDTIRMCVEMMAPRKDLEKTE